MVIYVQRNDRFLINSPGREGRFTCAKVIGDGIYAFINEATGRMCRISGEEIEALICDRLANRLIANDWIARLDPHALMDPTHPGLSRAEQKRILAAQDAVRDAATKLFYVQKFDESDGVSKGEGPLKAFIKRHRQEALALGLTKFPSSTQLRVAIAKGVPRDRHLLSYMSMRGKIKGKNHDPWVDEALQTMLNRYYSKQGYNKDKVIARFIGEAIEENKKRSPEHRFEYPKETALGNYIRTNETEELLAKREGPLTARRKYKGKSPSEQAIAPLDMVQIDQTQIDTHLNIYDEDGEVVARKRPWLVSIIDLYSRMILALFLSFDAPSSYTVMAAISQMLKPKKFLTERYGFDGGTTDGYGTPTRIRFDNAVENIGLSMRALLGAAGIGLELAPRATPEAKWAAERAFDAYNKGVWHGAPGGIPHKPHVLAARRLDPRELAAWSLDVATEVLWDWIVKHYHVKYREELGASSVRLWVEGTANEQNGREVFQDIALVDTICGVTRRANLTGDGIRLDGHHFHDQILTTSLLASLLPSARQSIQRRSHLQTGVAVVEVVKYPKDCSKIAVLDTERRQYIVLPNTKPRFTAGLSWDDADAIRRTDRASEKQFISDDELYLRRLDHFRLLDSLKEEEQPKKAVRSGNHVWRRSRRSRFGKAEYRRSRSCRQLQVGKVSMSLDQRLH